MIQAFNTLANQGILTAVHLNQDSNLQNYQVFSKEVVLKMNEILKYAVENSPVSNLKPKELEVCAKSGTAQVAVGGEYTQSDTIGSYIGFSPCTNPKYTMIVTINNPKTSSWGSSTAAPIWFEIAQNLEFLL
jgi:cell division protein FtsI/penicillin-binding protein 2